MKRKWVLPGIAAFMALIFGGNWALRPCLSFLTERVQQILFTMVIPYGILLPVGYGLLRPMEKVSSGCPQPYGIREVLQAAVIQTGLSLPVVCLLNIVSMGFSDSQMPDFLQAWERLPFYLFLLLIFNPVMEEFVFRKLILERLRIFGDRKAIFLSAAFFAVPHLFSQGLPQLGYTFVLGIVWAHAAMKSGRLTECMILHAFSNLYGFFLPMILTKTREGTMLYVILNAIMIFSGIFLAVRQKRANGGQKVPCKVKKEA